MFSLQSLFGDKNKVFELLQASADAAHDAARAVDQLARDRGKVGPRLDAFRAARHREKELMTQISAELIRTFVTPIDREDIERINTALYRIPKTAGKFAARYVLVAERLQGLDFSDRTELLAACTETVAEMVREMRSGLKIEPMQKLQASLQLLEGRADRLLLEPYGELYIHETDPIRAMLAKDLFETIEKAVDTCRDVGNVIYSIVLKNS